MSRWVDQALDVLGYLLVHPGLSARELSAELGIPHPSLRKVIKRLVDGRYLTRRKVTFPALIRLAGSPPWLYVYFPTERARLVCEGVLPRVVEPGVVDPKLDRLLWTAWWWRVHVNMTALSEAGEGAVKWFEGRALRRAEESAEAE